MNELRQQFLARRLRPGGAIGALCVLGSLLVAGSRPASAVISTNHLPSDAAVTALVEAGGGAFRFATEVLQRGEDGGKLEMRPRPVNAPGDPAVSRNLKKWMSGAAVPFILTFDGQSRVTLTVTPKHKPRSVTNRPAFTVSPDFNELFLRTEAEWAGARVLVSNLVLDGVAIPGSSSAEGGASGALDILRIQGGSLTGGFTLAGSITMSWPHRKHGGGGERAKLDFQVWGARVAEADATPPTVAITAPAKGSLLATALPTITAAYADAGSGIDLASVRLILDGLNRTAEAQVTGSGLTFLPTGVLAEGQHQADVTVRDADGNEARVGSYFIVDSVPPSLTLLAPTASSAAGYPRVGVLLGTSDETSGLDWSSSSVQIDGIEIAGSCGLDPGSVSCSFSPIHSGTHRLSVTIRDRAGNEASASREFDFLLDQTPPALDLEAPRNGEVTRASTVPVRGAVSDVSRIRSLSVNGQEVAVVDGRFLAEIALQEGVNSASIVAYDIFGYSSSVEAKLIRDTAPPTLELTRPQPGQNTNQDSILLAGTSRDATGLAALEVNGLPISSRDGVFDFEVPLSEGRNLLTIRAVDLAGNSQQTSREVFRYSIPTVTIDFPPDLSFIAATTTEVRGSVSDPLAAVNVNGVDATVAGSSFIARDVPLIEGGNSLTAVAETPGGRLGIATIQAVRDLFPPRVNVDVPADGASVSTPTVTAAGLVNDIVAGTVNAMDAVVTVNGRRASVANRSFLLEGVPLVLGRNTLAVVATDASGNTSETQLTVFRAEPVGPRLAVVAGDRQQGVIRQALGQPLVVELRDSQGSPIVGEAVVFRVLGGDGTLTGRRRALDLTDATGRASTSFTLGGRAGAGNQRVEAFAPGPGSAVLFTFDTLPGAPEKLLVDSGDQQVGVAGQVLPRPLVAVVTDAAFNRLEGVALRWTVVKGAGHFRGGAQELLTISDSDGRAIAPFILDVDEGIAANVVEARLEGMDPSPVAFFVATGRASGPPAALTAVSGVVLDNSNLPVSGATLRIVDTLLVTQSNSEGAFRFPSVPSGSLRLIADGSTVERTGAWPTLELDVVPVPGRDNALTMPVYLLPLSLADGLFVDETHGGTVELPGVPGFALEVRPGSVLFPSGSRSGVVSATLVHNDKIPMVPSFGQQPRLIVTIQPAGARFDPPARLILPNVEGLRPGEVTEFYSFDHDLGHFISIGPATVSDDGSIIVSNPGVGILKAGWHCGGNPAATGTPHGCPPCTICSDGQCVEACSRPQGLTGSPAESAFPEKADSSCACDACFVGSRCSGGCFPLKAGSVIALADGRETGAVATKGKAVTFSPSELRLPGCSQIRYLWRFDDGTTSTSAVTGHAFASAGAHTIRLEIRCGSCDLLLAKDDVDVTVIGLEVRVTSGATQENVTGAKNWATVRGLGTVQLEAVLTPDSPEAARRVQWTGATSSAEDPKKATIDRTQPVHMTVTARVDNLSDSVDIWVLWAELELRAAGFKSPMNEGRTNPDEGFPLLGPLTDEDNDIRHAEACGNVEIVGHLQPPGVEEVVRGGWKLQRWVSQNTCANGSFFVAHAHDDDTSEPFFTDYDPIPDSNIYDIDGPTAGLGFTVTHTREVYFTFEQYATWSGKRASEDLLWHYQAWIDDDLDVASKPKNRDTLLNDVGPGSLALPTSCHFRPRL